jgi:hypothetical protein
MSSDHQGHKALLDLLVQLAPRVRKDLLALLVRRAQPVPAVR